MCGTEQRSMRYLTEIAAVLQGSSEAEEYDPTGATPADLSNVLLWLEASTSTVTNAANGSGGAMVDGQTVGRWIRPGDSPTSPAFPYATQTVGADKPVLNTVQGKYWLESDVGDHADLSSDVVLSGDFVLWAVVRLVTPDIGEELDILRDSTGSARIYIQVVGAEEVNLVVVNDSGNTVLANIFGYDDDLLVRIRRVSGTVHLLVSGFAEANAGSLAGTLTCDMVASGTLDNGIGAIVISTNAVYAASPPSFIDGASGYFATSTANVESAWGVSI